MSLAPERLSIGIRRHFTTPGVHPFDQVAWERRDARITNWKDGSVAFCIVQKTFKMGWLSIEALRDAMAGKPLPKVTDTGVLFVARDNVGSYMQEMKKEFAGK